MNYFFTIVYSCEVILKIIALGKSYFFKTWNLFDFVITILGLIAMILEEMKDFKGISALIVIRIFRLGRVLYFFRKSNKLKIIFQTFLTTLPSIINVGSLLLLLIYIYAILTFQLFAPIKLSPPLNDYINFQTFGNSLLTLFILSTGDNLPQIFIALMQKNSIMY